MNVRCQSSSISRFQSCSFQLRTPTHVLVDQSANRRRAGSSRGRDSRIEQHIRGHLAQLVRNQ